MGNKVSPASKGKDNPGKSTPKGKDAAKKPDKPKSPKPKNKKKCWDMKNKKKKPKDKKKKKCCECCKKKKCCKCCTKCCKCCKKKKCCPCCKKKPTKKKRKPCIPKRQPQPSLDVLKCTEYFIVKRNIEPLSCYDFFKTVKPSAISDEALKFDIYDNCGCRLLIAIEINDACSICFCESDRTTNFVVLDTCGKHLFTITRDIDFCCCLGVVFCRDIVGQNIQIRYPNRGPLIGKITQQCRCSSCCQPLYHIRNRDGIINFRVSGHSDGFCFCKRIACPDQFIISSQQKSKRLDGQRIHFGKISSIWNTLTKEKFPRSDCDDVIFGAKFPKDADVKLKASILGLMILINFHHYQYSPCPIWRTLTCCVPRLCCLGF